jgi:menaquinone C8-methyltransferase
MSLRRFGIAFAEPDPPPTPEEVARAFPAVPGLYLHVPFCSTLCPFCPYNKVRHRDDLAAAYLRRLEREADRYLGALPGPFPSLYVGGGTPTLCLDGMARLLGRLPVTGERAIEVLPAHMTTDGAMRLEDIGFDFVSIGVQSFDAGVLRRLRRPGSPAINRAAVETAVGRFACVDVDLIFDTAYDEPGVLLDDLETCFEHGVDQVSTYPLMRFGYTPFGKARHDRRREHRLLRAATDLAASHGYGRGSVWTFNRRGGQSYTSITRPYYLGLGAVRRRSPAACSR